MKVGELYSYRGRRARLERIGFFPGGDSYLRPLDHVNPYAEAVFATGRSFDNEVVLRANRYFRDRINDVTETWEDMKQRKVSERAQRNEAEQITSELRGSLAKLGLRGGFVTARGEVTVYGSLPELRVLASALTAYAEDLESRPDSPALAELLG